MQSEEDLQRLLRSKNLEKVGTLGSGAKGAVLLVQSRTSSGCKPFALKRSDKVEVRALKALGRCRNVVSLLDHFLDPAMGPDEAWACLEYMEGGTLRSMLRTYRPHRLPEAMIQAILVQTLLGVKDIHAKGWMHRDIKAENIGVVNVAGPGGMPVIKLLDFDSACVLPVGSKSLYEVIGTVENMAPEVFEGAYNALADCWSVGIIAYELLFGYRPFNDASMDHLEEMVRSWDKYLMIPSDATSPQSSFLTGMLTSSSARMTASEAARHTWVHHARRHLEGPSGLPKPSSNSARGQETGGKHHSEIAPAAAAEKKEKSEPRESPASAGPSTPMSKQSAATTAATTATAASRPSRSGASEAIGAAGGSPSKSPKHGAGHRSIASLSSMGREGSGNEEMDSLLRLQRSISEWNSDFCAFGGSTGSLEVSFAAHQDAGARSSWFSRPGYAAAAPGTVSGPALLCGGMGWGHEGPLSRRGPSSYGSSAAAAAAAAAARAAGNSFSPSGSASSRLASQLGQPNPGGLHSQMDHGVSKRKWSSRHQPLSEVMEERDGRFSSSPQKSCKHMAGNSPAHSSSSVCSSSRRLRKDPCKSFDDGWPQELSRSEKDLSEHDAYLKKVRERTKEMLKAANDLAEHQATHPKKEKQSKEESTNGQRAAPDSSPLQVSRRLRRDPSKTFDEGRTQELNRNGNDKDLSDHDAYLKKVRERTKEMLKAANDLAEQKDRAEADFSEGQSANLRSELALPARHEALEASELGEVADEGFSPSALQSKECSRTSFSFDQRTPSRWSDSRRERAREKVRDSRPRSREASGEGGVEAGANRRKSDVDPTPRRHRTRKDRTWDDGREYEDYADEVDLDTKPVPACSRQLYEGSEQHSLLARRRWRDFEENPTAASATKSSSSSSRPFNDSLHAEQHNRKRRDSEGSDHKPDIDQDQGGEGGLSYLNGVRSRTQELLRQLSAAVNRPEPEEHDDVQSKSSRDPETERETRHTLDQERQRDTARNLPSKSGDTPTSEVTATAAVCTAGMAESLASRGAACASATASTSAESNSSHRVGTSNPHELGRRPGPGQPSSHGPVVIGGSLNLHPGHPVVGSLGLGLGLTSTSTTGGIHFQQPMQPPPQQQQLHGVALSGSAHSMHAVNSISSIISINSTSSATSANGIHSLNGGNAAPTLPSSRPSLHLAEAYRSPRADFDTGRQPGPVSISLPVAAAASDSRSLPGQGAPEDISQRFVRQRQRDANDTEKENARETKSETSSKEADDTHTDWQKTASTKVSSRGPRLPCTIPVRRPI